MPVICSLYQCVCRAYTSGVARTRRENPEGGIRDRLRPDVRFCLIDAYSSIFTPRICHSPAAAHLPCSSSSKSIMPTWLRFPSVQSTPIGAATKRGKECTFEQFSGILQRTWTSEIERKDHVLRDNTTRASIAQVR